MKELTEQLKNILAELRQRFEELYGDRLAEIILSGSQARGDADAAFATHSEAGSFL